MVILFCNICTVVNNIKKCDHSRLNGMTICQWSMVRRGFFYGLTEVYREKLQYLDFRCVFEDCCTVDGNVLWLKGPEDTS
jgi:hypothetical protein